VDFDEDASVLCFARECEGLPVQEMVRLVDTSATMPMVAAASAAAEPVKTQTAARRRN
jgi:hypothetical protein